MKRIITYSFLLFVLLSGCEDVYRPDIDVVDNVLVADARISADEEFNSIHLYESVAYYDNSRSGPGITTADVKLIDSNGNEQEIPHYSDGQYVLSQSLNPQLQYKLKIEYQGEVYESTFEEVPQKPSLDSVYGIEEVQIRQESGDNDVDNVDKIEGVRLYTDITPNNQMPYSRFTARFVVQYNYSVEVPGPFGSTMIETVYGWKTTYPQGAFNIASPPEYSSSKEIKKHPLYFYKNSVKYDFDQFFSGWIVILHHHALSENAYNYYDDLNKQLESEGKIFDPLYVQARSNIKCISDSDQKILGNFEISMSNETRYFLRYMSKTNGFVLREIEERYDIPFSGEQVGVIPVFWQYP
ncbi:DUF4249 domain-containing protein [Draconibacterium halophilum]|uniref:DUF4249 domain-containing protein n=1 Tax=Draconibacterium halophilum TaxID=2706887 RepID=A0A6C0RID0_9BACT|nr:DUF4249 domain-containing protein [Draconibacterium halophilum]QIA09303.1 DUF4249 domain-containing protein [Draconibacterium halophilum]